MRFTGPISFLIALLLVMMMICPAVAALQKSASNSDSRCHSEGEPPQQEETVLCCCDQNVIPVDQHHAPHDVSTFHSSLVSTTNERALSKSDVDDVPFLKTSVNLAKLSILRL